MEPFATLTCSRGDRELFLDFCTIQLDRMTLKPSERILINRPPKSDQPDITERLKEGVALIKTLGGIDVVYIVEDDDYLPKDYFNLMWIGENDFIGCSKTLYYNLRNKTYNEFTHPNRSSLFCTGFRISALDKFVWPSPETVFFDLALWQYARLNKKRIKLMDESIGVGIKHGIGLTAGVGHRAVMPNKDPNGSFLRSKVDSEAFKFYQSIS